LYLYAVPEHVESGFRAYHQSYYHDVRIQFPLKIHV
jgi:hypothetical protein